MIEITWKDTVDLYQELKRLKDAAKITDNPFTVNLIYFKALDIVNTIQAQESLNKEIKEVFTKILEEMK